MDRKRLAKGQGDGLSKPEPTKNDIMFEASKAYGDAMKGLARLVDSYHPELN